MFDGKRTQERMDDNLMDGWLFRSFVDEGRPFIFSERDTIPYVRPKNITERTRHRPSCVRISISFVADRSCCVLSMHVCACSFFWFSFLPKIDKGHRPFLSLSVDNKHSQHDKKYHWPFLRFIYFLVSIQTSQIHSFPSLSSFVLCVVK